MGHNETIFGLEGSIQNTKRLAVDVFALFLPWVFFRIVETEHEAISRHAEGQTG